MGILENVRDLAELVKKTGDIEFYRKIVALEGEVIELTRQNRLLETKVAELDQKLTVQASLSFEAPFWWQEGDDTPFCPSCWELKRQAIHVVYKFSNAEFTRWDCSVCKTIYAPKLGKARKPPDPTRPNRNTVPRGGAWT